MIVYCKKDYFNFSTFFYGGCERNYYKCNSYQSFYQTSEKNDKIFVYTNIKTGEGLWLEKEVFNKHFTYDKNFLRQQKLERIIDEESVL